MGGRGDRRWVWLLCAQHPLRGGADSLLCRLRSVPPTILTPLALQSHLGPPLSFPHLLRAPPQAGAHIKVGDAPVNLSPVTIGSGGRRSGGQAAVGDGARVPVGPVDAARLDVHIHGVDADALIALEGLLVR